MSCEHKLLIELTSYPSQYKCATCGAYKRRWEDPWGAPGNTDAKGSFEDVKKLVEEHSKPQVKVGQVWKGKRGTYGWLLVVAIAKDCIYLMHLEGGEYQTPVRGDITKWSVDNLLEYYELDPDFEQPE